MWDSMQERERVGRGREKEIESWKIEKVGLTMLRFVGAVWSKGYFLSIQEKSSSGKINCSSPLAFLVGNLVGTFAKDSQKILFFFFFLLPLFLSMFEYNSGKGGNDFLARKFLTYVYRGSNFKRVIEEN